MKRGLTLLIGATCVMFVLAYRVRGNAQQPPPAASRPAAAVHQAVLSEYCYACHNDKVKSGGLTAEPVVKLIRRPISLDTM